MFIFKKTIQHTQGLKYVSSGTHFHAFASGGLRIRWTDGSLIKICLEAKECIRHVRAYLYRIGLTVSQLTAQHIEETYQLEFAFTRRLKNLWQPAATQ